MFFSYKGQNTPDNIWSRQVSAIHHVLYTASKTSRSEPPNSNQWRILGIKLCYSYRDFLEFFKIIIAICRLVSQPWIFEMKTSFARNLPKNRAKVYEFSSSQQAKTGTFFSTAIHVNTQLVTHCYVLNIYFKWEWGNYFNLRFCTEKSEKLVKLTKECTLLKACTYNIVISLFECLKTLQITAACGNCCHFLRFQESVSNMTTSASLKTLEKVLVKKCDHTSPPQ